VRIELPALRERGDDLGLLAEFFINRPQQGDGQEGDGPRPGSVSGPQAISLARQRARVTKRDPPRAGLDQGDQITVDDLPDEVVVAAGSRESPTGVPQGYFQLRDEYVARFERQYLADLLKRHSGDVPTAAREAKLPRGTLYRLLKNHDMDPANYR
jgi:DNA-binding NtrC family response regulator